MFMLNPPNSSQNPGSYVDLLKRLTQRVHQAKADDQILESMQQVVEKELDQQKIVLSRPERVRLFRQVTRAVLTDLLAKLDGEK
jgi:hypothetical protein